MISENIDEAVFKLCVDHRGVQTETSRLMADHARKAGYSETAESIRCRLSRTATGVEEPNLHFLQRIEDTREVYPITEFLCLRNSQTINHIIKRLAELGHLPEVFGRDKEKEDE